MKDSDLTSSGNSQAEVLLNIENLIKGHDSKIVLLKEEIRKNKEMMDDVLDNDPTYKLHDEEAKKAAKVKSQTKSQIMKQPNMTILNGKIKDLKIQMKELTSALSEYLREYQRLTGSNEIVGDDGEVREIVYTAKLVKKTSRNNR